MKKDKMNLRNFNLNEHKQNGLRFRSTTLIFMASVFGSALAVLYSNQWFAFIMLMACFIYIYFLRFAIIKLMNDIVELKIKYEGLK